MVLQQIINENAGRTTTNDVIRQFRNYRGSANEYGLNIDAKLGRTAAHNFLYLLGDLDSPYKEEDDDEDDDEGDEDSDSIDEAMLLNPFVPLEFPFSPMYSPFEL